MEAWENEMLCHQAHLDWTKDGDRNSKFYHAIIKEQRQRQITQLTRADEVTWMVTEFFFFFELFSASPHHMDIALFPNIKTHISVLED